MADLTERLRERAESYRAGGPSSEHTALLLEEAADRIASLEAALKPFARENDLPRNLPDETRLNIQFAGQIVAHATFGDFRRAAALSSSKQKDGE